MKYRSTRGGCSGLSFEDAVYSGFTSDGGILMPESIPTVSSETLRSWAQLSYPGLVKQILPYFIDEHEISQSDLNDLVDRAFSRFTLPEIVKLSPLASDLNVLELFHGPTMAFKDLALSCLGQFLQYFLTKRQKHITVLVGTSGDTGSAAMESVRGLSCVDIVVLLPRGRCTRIQELQMTTVIEDNVHLYRADGSSDDIDVPIKACFMDEMFAKKHNLGSLNSINWARILVQMAHYFYAYLQVCPEVSETVEIVVPTGACGNITAGCIAYQMGLPIQLTCAVNSNDIVARTVANGDFSVAKELFSTLAPAMDIQVPYNMERLFYLFSGHDMKLVRSLLENMEESGKVTVPTDLHNKIRSVVNSHIASDADIKASMKRCWDDNSYLLCPHTAVAAHYHYTSQRDHKGLKRVCVATASPAKFEEAVSSAGLTPQPNDAIKKLLNKPTKYLDMEQGQDWEAILRSKIEAITTSLHH